MCKKLIDFSKTPGGTFSAFAASLYLTRDTLYKWAQENPEFLYAKKVAKLNQERVLFDIGMKGIRGKLPGFAGGPWIFTMKALHSWNENGPIEPDEQSELEFDNEDEESSA